MVVKEREGVPNSDLIMNKEKKDWMKNYYKIIQELETMANIQLQIQNIIKLANTPNNQLADIKTILLEMEEIHKMQIGKDIFIISYYHWHLY